ncbi:MAG: GxxExxY protein [Verrucomicrobiota bacterium]
MKLTEGIIGAAMAVHRELGPGLDEKIYENSLCLELGAQGRHYTQQEQFNVHYRGHFVGKLITDLIVENKVVVEAKVAESIGKAHVAQTLSYLTITGLEVGLILNFRTPSLTFKRVAKLANEQNPS